MIKKRTIMTVTIEQDGVEGWGHEPEDHVKWLRSHLDSMIPWYHPTVEYIKTES